MEESLKTLFDFCGDPYTHLADWKARNNRKVMGLTPMYLPEELIHAGGMLPVEMWSSNEPITVGHAHVTPYYCGLTRSIVDDLLKGKLDFIDGILTYETCIQARTIMLIVEKNCKISFLEAIFLPNQMTNPLTRPYLIESLEILKVRLEEFAGHEITEDSIRESIIVYNRNRKLLRKIYDLRRKRPGLINVQEMVPIVHSSMLMLKEDHNAALEKLIVDLEKRSHEMDNRPKVILVGSLCTAPSTEILKLFDDSGVVVVDDDLYTGTRYFVNDAAEDGVPIEALADRFLTRNPPCATKVDSTMNWSDYIINMVNESEAQGVITLIQKNCPPHMCYSPDVMRKLSEANIPELVLEVEHEVVSLEQMRTRLQAFKETLGGV